MGVSKVIYKGETVIDISTDTVTEDSVKAGVTFHGSDGELRIGTHNTSHSAIPIEVSTESEMTALLDSGEVGGVYKYTGTTGVYENGALYVLEASE